MLNSLYNLPSKSQGSQMSQEDRRILTLAGSVGDEAVNINISTRTKTVNYGTTSNGLNSNWSWNLNSKLITQVMYIVCLKLIAFDIVSVSMLNITHATNINISTSHINGSHSYLNSNISISSNITSDITATIGNVNDVLTYTTTAEDSSSSDDDVFIIVYLVLVPVLGFGIVCVAAMMCKCDDTDHRDARDPEKQLSAAMENNNNNDEDNNEYEGWEEWNEEETSEWVKQLLINDNIDNDAINTFLQNDCPNMTGATMLKMKKNERLLKLFEQRGSNKSFAMFVAISAAIENLPWPGDENQENDDYDDDEDNHHENQDNNDNDDEDDEYYDV